MLRKRRPDYQYRLNSVATCSTETCRKVKATRRLSLPAFEPVSIQPSNSTRIGSRIRLWMFNPRLCMDTRANRTTTVRSNSTHFRPLSAITRWFETCRS